MHKTIESQSKQNGYILIEIAIVMIVMSALIAVSIPLYRSYETRNAIQETQQRIDIVSRAFSTYAQTHSRLPCPAAPSVGSTEQMGVERGACIVTTDAHGIVPYRTLGIPEQYAKDGYGNFFTYTVSPDFTADTRLGVRTGPLANHINLRLSHLVDDNNFALLPRAQFCAPLDTSGNDINVVQDGNTLFNGDPRTTSANVPRPANNVDANLFDGQANREITVTAVAMALISHGDNGYGAYQANGNQAPTVGAGPAEIVTSTNTNNTIETESQWSDSGANIYDDIVRFFTQDQIFAAAGSNSCEHL